MTECTLVKLIKCTVSLIISLCYPPLLQSLPSELLLSRFGIAVDKAQESDRQEVATTTAVV